jgi:tRNA threonylcarbamoyladenosine biosynthesis protein TsaB
VLVLAIDASTYVGSVALIRDGYAVAEASAAMRGEREERLMPAISSLLKSQGIAVDALDAVACGAGPGSFTSLRIAASIAKGLSAARSLPLLVAPSTLLVAAAANPVLRHGNYVVAMDAMRGDFFCQDVSVLPSGALQPGEAGRMNRELLEDHAASRSALIIGPAESPPMSPHARGFALLIRERIAQPVEMTSWEPNYGRKAEAQVRWEAAHGRELGAD